MAKKRVFKGFGFDDGKLEGFEGGEGFKVEPESVEGGVGDFEEVFETEADGLEEEFGIEGVGEFFENDVFVLVVSFEVDAECAEVGKFGEGFLED